MLDPIAEVNDRVEELLLFRRCGDCSVHFEQVEVVGRMLEANIFNTR